MHNRLPSAVLLSFMILSGFYQMSRKTSRIFFQDIVLYACPLLSCRIKKLQCRMFGLITNRHTPVTLYRAQHLRYYRGMRLQIYPRHLFEHDVLCFPLKIFSSREACPAMPVSRNKVSSRNRVSGG